MNKVEAYQPPEFKNSATPSASRSNAPALRASRAPSQPPPFRAKYKTELRDPRALPPKEDPPQARKRSRGDSIWHNKDVRLMIAILLTAALVTFVYQTMKGAGTL